MGKKKQEIPPAKGPERAAETSTGVKVISENRKARFNYHILEEFEAGMVLTGAEIKSIRVHGITLSEAYVRPFKDEIVLIGAHIEPYKFDASSAYVPTRTRKLLLHRDEIDKLRGRVEQKGLTIVPLKLYLKRGMAKLLIGLAKGKDNPDKRKSIKEREGKREVARAIKSQR